MWDYFLVMDAELHTWVLNGRSIGATAALVAVVYILARTIAYMARQKR